MVYVRVISYPNNNSTNKDRLMICAIIEIAGGIVVNGATALQNLICFYR